MMRWYSIEGIDEAYRNVEIARVLVICGYIAAVACDKECFVTASIGGEWKGLKRLLEAADCAIKRLPDAEIE